MDHTMSVRLAEHKAYALDLVCTCAHTELLDTTTVDNILYRWQQHIKSVSREGTIKTLSPGQRFIDKGHAE